MAVIAHLKMLRKLTLLILISYTASTGTANANPVETRKIVSTSSPIAQIPGTNLFTGIPYKLGMKKFPSGWVTWTEAKTQHEGNYVQIDLSPDHFIHYEPGQKWSLDNQWIFGQSEEPGWYTLTNRGVPGGVTTWSYEEVGNGYHIILSRKKADVVKLSKGNEWRNDALWKPVASNQDGFYQLVMKAYPEGVVTWTEKKYGDYSHYIQVDVNIENRNHYEPSEKWYDDSLFRFDSVEVHHGARIQQFEFSPLTCDQQVWNTPGTIIFFNTSNPTANARTVRILDMTNEDKKNKLTLTFEPEIALAEFPDIDLLAELPWFAESPDDSFQPVEDSRGHVWVGNGPQGCTTSLEVPAYTTVQGSIDCKWVEDISIPFKAKLAINGTEESVGNDKKLVPIGVLEHSLRNLSWYDPAIITKDNENQFLMIQLSGTLKGSFGFKSKFITKEIIQPPCFGEITSPEINDIRTF